MQGNEYYGFEADLDLDQRRRQFSLALEPGEDKPANNYPAEGSKEQFPDDCQTEQSPVLPHRDQITQDQQRQQQAQRIVKLKRGKMTKA